MEGDDVEVNSKGITTVYDGIFAITTVSRKGVPRALKKRAPKWARVKHAHYIEGETLTRVSVYEGLGTNTIKTAVRLVSDTQRRINCDDCLRLHRPTNKNCSATLGIKTNARKAGVLYKWENKKSAGKWRKTDLEIGGREKVGVAEYTKV